MFRNKEQPNGTDGSVWYLCLCRTKLIFQFVSKYLVLN